MDSRPTVISRRLAIIGIAVILFVLVLWGIRWKSTDHIIFTPRVVTYGYTLHNSTRKPVDRIQLYVYLPLETSSHSIGDVKSNYDYQELHDGLGQRIAKFSFDNFPPYGSKTIQIKATVLMASRAKSFEINNEDWLQPQQLIESDDPILENVATDLAVRNELDTVQNIYKYVSEHISYAGYSSREKGALAAFKDKKGDCTEFAALYVALVRAAGIPARYLGGYVALQDKVLKPAEYHNWAEVYLDGKWVIVDPQEKKFGQEAQGYIAMEIVTGDIEGNQMKGKHRYRLEGEGVTVTMVK